MTMQKTYICDSCGKQKRGIPYGELADGNDGMPEDWSDLRLQDFGKPIRAYFRHYCPGCTKRMIAIINEGKDAQD